MYGLLKQPGYRLHPPDSSAAGALLAEQGVTRADLDRALVALERSDGIRVRSIVGINHDGVFGSTREGWHPDLPDACKEPCSGSKSWSCWAECPRAAPRDSSRTARCRTDRSDTPPLCRHGRAPGGDLASK